METYIVKKILKQTVLGYENFPHRIITTIENIVICDNGKTYRCQHMHYTSRTTDLTNIGDFRNFTKIDDDE